MDTFNPVLMDDLDLLTGLAAERLNDLGHAGALTSRKALSISSQAAHARLHAFLTAAGAKAATEPQAATGENVKG